MKLTAHKVEFGPVSFGKKASWQEAVLYCQFLEHNGHRDWRLPTNFELVSYLPKVDRRTIQKLISNDSEAVHVSYFYTPMWYDNCWAGDDKGKKGRTESDELYVIPVRDVS